MKSKKRSANHGTNNRQIKTGIFKRKNGKVIKIMGEKTFWRNRGLSPILYQRPHRRNKRNTKNFWGHVRLRMKKSEKIYKQYLKDSNSYMEFLINHGIKEEDYSFREYMEDTKWLKILK